MRHILLLGAALTTLTTFGQMQFRHGPRVGLAMASQTAGGQFLAWRGLPKFGPILGWSFDVPVTEQIHVLIEPNWIHKGSWTRNSTMNTNTFVTLKYIELPVLAKLSMNPDPGGLFLSGGPIFGYWMGGKTRTTMNGAEQMSVTYNLQGTNAKRQQWSLAVGLGNEKRNFMWEIRAQSSVTPFDPLLRVQNLVFGLHLTFRLPLTARQKEQEG